MTPKEIANIAYAAADGRKAQDIVVLYVNKLTTLADYYIICTGQATPHIRAIADAVDEALGKLGVPPLHREGYPSASWILQDYGSVVVHILKNDTREFYGLERLWADAPKVDPETLKKGGEVEEV